MHDTTRRAVNSGIEMIASAIDDECSRASGGAGSERDHFAGLIGRSPPMRRLFDQVRKVAPTGASVLLVGESGTGKEMVARALHETSRRAEEPFVAVNCGGIPETLIEAELFGFERGSFTGALKAHAGHFERAGRGTLFLDEITEMSPEMQVKLLRVLESRRFRRVGGDHELEYDCRVIAATNRDPQIAINEGRLRSDLLYRLAGFPLTLPPLRDREGDAALLARHFLGDLNAAHGTWKEFTPESLRWIGAHPWPGNVRELHNAVHRAFILADQELDVRAATLAPKTAPVVDDANAVRVPIGTSLADAERWIVIATLKQCGGNKTRAAATLGLSLKTLYNRLHAWRAEEERKAHANGHANGDDPA